MNEDFFAYFWLICGFWVGIGNALFMRLSLRKPIAMGQFTKAEVNAFLLKCALWIFLPCLALWLLQQSCGTGTPLEYLKWPEPQKTAALALQLFLWGALLYWVFRRSGANTLSRYVMAAKPSMGLFVRPIVFKAIAVIAVLGGLVSLFATHT